MGDLFSLDNPYADVKPLSRKEQALIEQLEQDNQKAREYNESKKHEKVLLGPLKRFCGLCEGPLVKTKKSDTLEGLEIEVPRWKCKTCGQIYTGFGLELYTQNKKGKAIVFPVEEGL